MDEYTFTLSRDDYETLLLMLGVATAAVNDGKLACSFLRLANEINKNNRDWRPYDVPPAKEI